MSNIGRKNIYLCQSCRKVAVTIDIHDGVTPFMITCVATKGCKGFMYSQFYDCDQRLPHKFEWFKPDSFDGYDEATVEHFKKGGLTLRTKAGEELWKDMKVKSRRRRHRRHAHIAANGGIGDRGGA